MHIFFQKAVRITLAKVTRLLSSVKTFSNQFNANALRSLNTLKPTITDSRYQNLLTRIGGLRARIKKLLTKVNSYLCLLRQTQFNANLKTLEVDDKKLFQKFQQLKNKCGPGKFLKISILLSYYSKFVSKDSFLVLCITKILVKFHGCSILYVMFKTGSLR